jgi:hypothetical protein
VLGDPAWKLAAIVKLKDGQKEVVTVSPAGVVSILDPKSGIVRLGTAPNNVRSAHGPVTATADGSAIFLACEAAGIVALDAETLREKWRSPSGEAFSVPPLVVDLGGDGHFEVVACADSGNVVILDPESGALVSSEPLAQATSERSPPRGPPGISPAGERSAGQIIGDLRRRSAAHEDVVEPSSLSRAVEAGVCSGRRATAEIICSVKI